MDKILKFMTIDGITYAIYRNQISIEGIEYPVYYGRTVRDADVEQLSHIINLGKWHKVREIREATENGIHNLS